MFKKFWQKDDPLLKLFFEKYQLNLLSIPRENVKLCDVYSRKEDNKVLSSPSNLAYILEPPFDINQKKQEESLSDVSGLISKGSSIDSAFEFLQGFLPLLGVDSAVAVNLKTTFKRNGTSSIKFNFTNTIREYIDPHLLLSELGRYHIKEDSFYNDGYSRYYIVTGIARGSSISIIADDQSNKSIDIDVDALRALNTSNKITSDKSSKGMITFMDETRRLAFGIELYELQYNKLTKRLRMKLVDETFKVRVSGGESTDRIRKVTKRVIIGGQDDPFIDLE